MKTFALWCLMFFMFLYLPAWIFTNGYNHHKNRVFFETQKHRSQRNGKILIVATDRPLRNKQDTIDLVNQQKEWFMYDTISYRKFFQGNPLEKRTYTVIGDTFCLHAFKFSGIDVTHNINTPHAPVLIVDEPDSLFYQGMIY